MDEYQVLTKEGILYHGKFCASGYANRFSLDVAQCVTIDNIRVNSNPNFSLDYPFVCNPNGLTYCQYQVGTTVVFSLLCECGWGSLGYCPLPDNQAMYEYNNLTMQVLAVNKCHPYDRDNIFAQMDTCGLGVTDVDNKMILSNYTKARFNMY